MESSNTITQWQKSTPYKISISHFSNTHFRFTHTHFKIEYH